jgi:hypothetical protein
MNDQFARQMGEIGGDRMLIGKTLAFVRTFVDDLDTALKKIDPTSGLTLNQKDWLGFCLQGIFVTNSVCWKRFERASLGRWSHAVLSWRFRQGAHFWGKIFEASLAVILWRHGITTGVLVVDDSDQPRSKTTTRIYKAHALKDKRSGGTINGQNVVVLLLVTPVVTVPVGVEFYMPDPALTAWYKQERQLKARGVPKADRPPKPAPNPSYPTKQQIALHLLEQFRTAFPTLTIQGILADTLYGTETFLDQTSALFGGVQVVSQLRKNQNVRYKTQEWAVETFFQKFPGVSQQMCIRGGQNQVVNVGSARLVVSAHHCKRFVIALKYEGEEDYRYLVATDLTWRTLDILQAYTLRWLIEVFFEDWKLYEGWGQLAKQPDEDGSRRSLILSLLCDHCLLTHPEQLARLEQKRPACTVGSLREAVKVESLLQCVWDVVSSPDPQEQFQRLAQQARGVFTPASSTKHMVGRDLGRLEPTPSLEYRAQIVPKTA